MAEDGSERLQAVFDMFDTEGCGYISVNHFVQLAAEHFGSSDWDSSIQEAISKIIHVLDPDGNGKIQFVQFCEGVRGIMELQGPPDQQQQQQLADDGDSCRTDGLTLTVTDSAHHEDADEDNNDHRQQQQQQHSSHDDVVDDVTLFQADQPAYGQASSLEDDVDSGFSSRYTERRVPH
jgi:hypothetical protein